MILKDMSIKVKLRLFWSRWFPSVQHLEIPYPSGVHNTMHITSYGLTCKQWECRIVSSVVKLQLRCTLLPKHPCLVWCIMPCNTCKATMHMWSLSSKCAVLFAMPGHDRWQSTSTPACWFCNRQDAIARAIYHRGVVAGWKNVALWIREY